MLLLLLSEAAEANKNFGGCLIKINKATLSTALLGVLTVILEYFKLILEGLCPAFSKLGGRVEGVCSSFCRHWLSCINDFDI